MNSGKALDVDGGGTTNGSAIQIWTDNGTTAQQWKFKENADGSISFINVNSNKLLDITNGKDENGTRVQIYTDNGTSSQKWKLIR
ncbi:RICIN domain-containing protein [Paenibacillus sp. FSL R7-0302]|uniref:RICIN domain-containing protein n=1 Tax=Paenibacillus sp. FSL R7-0302 TaxID=2921681 RepID=UPI0030F79913